MKVKNILCIVTAACILTSVRPARAAYVGRESLSYLYAGNTSIYTNNVKRTQGNLTAVCPDYFEVTTAGALKLTRSVDPVFVGAMHEAGIRVVPFVSNHWDKTAGRAALANREALSTALVSQVANNNLDGLDIDIENIDHTDRTAFTDFIALLRRKLPGDKSLTVCVAANPYGWTTGWQGAYDYAALAPHVEHIFLMTYDESYSGGPAGPVASYDFMEKSVRYALGKTTPDKLMLGLPFYGRYWVQGEATGGLAFTVSDIEHLVSRYRSTVWYDDGKQCARATLVISPGDVVQGLWGGKKLSAGTYDIWYENDRSYKAKLALVKKYNLRGAGSWALGQEPASLWSGYRLWLYGLPFGDIEGHWAEEYIVSLFEAGLVGGTAPDVFSPGDKLTRAQSAVLLCRMCGLSETAGQAEFTDVAGHWAQGFIGAAAEKGIVKGFPGSVFRPDAPVTRQELAALIDRVLHAPSTIDFNQAFFTDVSPELTPWANNAIVTLTVHGVVGGYPDGSFRPGGHVTRAEAAKMFDLARALPLKNLALY